MPWYSSILTDLESAVQKAVANPDDEYAFVDSALEIVESLQKREDRFESMEPIFRLIERSPNIEYGGPGPLGSFFESAYAHGCGDRYEQQLLESLERNPTDFTTFLLFRHINAPNNPNREMYRDLLIRYADHNSLSAEWSSFLKSQLHNA